MIEHTRPPTVIVLHAYQPTTQDPKVLKRIVENCYVPFLKALRTNYDIKITLNINGCLLEKLSTEYPHVIQLIKEGLESKQIDLMGTAFYHPILPFLDNDDIHYQIKKQQEILLSTFNYKPTVFFAPEMAISQSILLPIIQNGFSFLVGSEHVHTLPVAGKYSCSTGTLTVIKRNSIISNNISFNHYKADSDSVLSDVSQAFKDTIFPVTIAMDLETYGEHIPEYYNFFFRFAQKLHTIHYSAIGTEYSKVEPIKEVVSSSWSTSEHDLHHNNPFPLWDHPCNAIHQLLHMHFGLLHQVKPHIASADWSYLYQSAHYSCQFWWASDHWWSGELIMKGLMLQRQALEQMAAFLPPKFGQIILTLSTDIIERVKRVIAVRG